MSDSRTIIKKCDPKLTTTTLAGIDTQVSVVSDAGKVYLEKSTINEKMDINSKVIPALREYPTLQVLMIGNGAGSTKTVSTGTFEFPLTVPVRHQPTDVGLYNAVPLCARPVNSPLSDEERKKYCMAKIGQGADGKRYEFYYGMWISVRGNKVNDYLVSVENNIQTITEFEYTDLNVNPTPPKIPEFLAFDNKDSIVVPKNGEYVTATIKYEIPFDEAAIQEYMNVCKILYNDPTAAVINEFAMCYAVKRKLASPSLTGVGVMMDESIGTQAGIFVSTSTNVAMDNGGLVWNVTVGQTAPLATATKDVAAKSSPVRGY